MPLFVLNTVAMPGQAFPLHIFEPRYRLMVRLLLLLLCLPHPSQMRRCMAGNRQFGLVAAHRGADGQWEMSRIGTVLRITDTKVLPDGRSYVQTVGTQRFEVLDTWIVDGYNAGKVAFFQDLPKQEGQEQQERQVYENVVGRLTRWANDAPSFQGGMQRFAEYLVRILSSLSSALLLLSLPTSLPPYLPPFPSLPSLPLSPSIPPSLPFPILIPP